MRKKELKMHIFFSVKMSVNTVSEKMHQTHLENSL